MFQEVSIVRSV
jgi:hypothetical protein